MYSLLFLCAMFEPWTWNDTQNSQMCLKVETIHLSLRFQTGKKNKEVLKVFGVLPSSKLA